MSACVLICVLVFLKLGEIKGLDLTSQICHLGDDHIGRCVPTSICPHDTSKSDSANLSMGSCETGKICCQISAKIVTPDNGNSQSASPVNPVSVPAMAPAMSTSSSQGVSGSPPAGGEPDGSPPSGASPAGASPGGTPPSGSSPSGASPGGTPPSGSSPGGAAPGGAPPSGSPPSGAPPSGAPPSGAPPGGAPPSGGSAPPLSGNIVVAPGLPSKSLPPPFYEDTIVVSAEERNNAIDILDRKCELYYSMVQTENTIPTRSGNEEKLTPVVMIFGGVDSKEKEFPHMAALGFGESNAKQWLCGGSLITENFVVTAAHCLSTKSIGEVRYVKLGNLQLDQDTQNTQLLNVIKRIPHPQYDPSSQYNDIALLQLDQNVRITKFVAPICLFSSINYEDRNLVATGWGRTESGSSSLTLQKVGLEVFTQMECQNAYRQVSRDQLPLGIQEALQLCAGSRSQSKDTCQGDSGGPLQIRKNNRWYLVGITSIGLQCGVANIPGVYTRVANYVQWIQQNVFNK